MVPALLCGLLEGVRHWKGGGVLGDSNEGRKKWRSSRKATGTRDGGYARPDYGGVPQQPQWTTNPISKGLGSQKRQPKREPDKHSVHLV